jgi:hypothetical protein
MPTGAWRIPKGRNIIGLAVAVSVGLAPIWAPPPREAHASGTQSLLPNLVADPPDNATLVTSSAEGATRLLLRFNGYVHNAGPGALDIRGSRERPTVAGRSTNELAEEIELDKRREQSLPPSLEQQLATPAMKVSQRVFTTNEGNPGVSGQYVERPHLEEPSSGEMVYSNADGHHHWHLQHVAKYSLWNAAKTAEVAPAQKVGFCLDDSQHVEPGQGPATPVYANDVPPYPGFCRRFEPNATGVYEGISPGWRDVYDRELAWQWVDVSDVLPGEYWLREDVDPNGVIKQAGGGAKSEYSKASTVIPGFDAKPQLALVNEDEVRSLTLTSTAYGDLATPVYTVLSGPEHGTLGELDGNTLTYTPALGYSGSDSFTFSTRDPNSPFPVHPAVATVSIAVASLKPSVSISGAPAQITAGTSIQLSATVANDTGGVEWESSAGVITPEDPSGSASLYRAPSQPPGAAVLITARLRDSRAVSDERPIAIEPAPQPEPAPELPSASAGPATQSPSSNAFAKPGSSGPSSGGSTPHTPSPALSAPHAMLLGRMLVMSTLPSVAGRVSLTAYAGRTRLGGCASYTPAERDFTCRITLGRTSLRARISLRATLRTGAIVISAARSAQRIPEMRMRPVGPHARAASGASVFWCSPSTLTGVLTGG